MQNKLMASTTVMGLALVLAAGPSAAAADRDFDGYTFAARRHLDVLAYRLWTDSVDVCWEMYRHYGHNPGFGETYREMYRLTKDAEHIHDLVHEGYQFGRHDVDHIASDLNEIDALFHHIQDDVRAWSPSYHGRYSGHDDHFGHYVHGRGFGDGLTRKMRYLEQTLHHLMADYGVRSQLIDGRGDLAPGRPSAPVPGGQPQLQVP